MTASFHDHFSAHAVTYARARPGWQRSLARAIRDCAPSGSCAADVGTGNGQLAVLLADFFDRVEASDASASQIHLATGHSRVRYRVAPADATGLAERSVDAITVAQALHWFATTEFFDEVRRIARDGAVFVAASYQLFTLSAEFDALVAELYAELDPDWPPQRRHIDEGYANIGIPFATRPLDGHVMEVMWSLEETLDYLRSWSAVQRNMVRTGLDPIARRRDAFARAFGSDAIAQRVRWPLIVRAGIVE